MLVFAEGPGWGNSLLNLLVLLLGAFLILLVLIQRGKGGGLAGAFGGAGGSSAFGSRAGDTFMWFTIYTTFAWLLLIMITIKVVQPPARAGGAADTQTAPATPDGLPPDGPLPPDDGRPDEKAP